MTKIAVENNPHACLVTHFGREEDESCTILMKIEDIANKIQSALPGESLESATLVSGNMEFKLKIYPNGVTTQNSADLALEVKVFNINNGKKKNWKCIESFAAENSDGEFFKTKTSYLKELIEKSPRFTNGLVLKHFLSHKTILNKKNSSYFPNGMLTVKANITVRGEETVAHKTTKYSSKTSSSQPQTDLADDFRSMLETRKFSDFRVICRGEAIPCHRSVVSARSEVFGAMLEHKLKETESGEVEINDFDVEIVRAVIVFMYTGQVEITKVDVEELIKAADKYRMEGLKNIIEDTLIKAVKIENALDMFVLGDAVHADKLRDISKYVIVRNAGAIVEMEGWRETLGSFQDLTLEIFESVVKSKPQSK